MPDQWGRIDGKYDNFADYYTALPTDREHQWEVVCKQCLQARVYFTGDIPVLPVVHHKMDCSTGRRHG